MELVDLSHGTVLPPTFGASLRAARLSRDITLDAVAAHTKINRAYFQDLERNDLSKWPSSQFYRETYLRAYAEAIGLDPREVIAGFRRQAAAAETSNIPAPISRPRRLTPSTIPIILAVTFAVAYSLARWLVPAPATPAAAVDKPAAAMSAGIDSARAPAVGTPAQESVAPHPDASAAVDPGQIEGELFITSTPPGTHVTVNGIGRGPTPVRVRYLPPGSYTIRFIHPGHPSATRHATISPERRRVGVSATFESPE